MTVIGQQPDTEALVTSEQQHLRPTKARNQGAEVQTQRRLDRGPRTPYAIKMEELRNAYCKTWEDLEPLFVHVADIEAKITDQRSLQNGGGALTLYTNHHYMHATMDAFHAGIGQFLFARLYTIPYDAWKAIEDQQRLDDLARQVAEGLVTDGD